jgi:hypothetical protein
MTQDESNVQEANAADATNNPNASADTDGTVALTHPKRRLSAKKVVLWALGIIVGLVIVILVGFNLYIRTTYNAFYEQATEQFEIPGIHEGFICQDLDYYDDADCWFFSGYASGDDVSPLYRRNADGSSVEFSAQLPDGSPYTGHGSGITTSSEYAFLTCDSGYLVFQASDLANAEAGDKVTAIDQVDLEITPAFMNIENDTLYVGTFHLMPDYEAPDHHHLITPDGSENAGMMFAYPADAHASYGFARQADRAYSLPDKVQGVSVLPNGDIVLSTSYGFNTSHLLTYRVWAQEVVAAAKDASVTESAERSLSFSADTQDDVDTADTSELTASTEANASDSGALAEANATTATTSTEANASDPTSSQTASSPYTFFVDGRSVPLFFLDSTNLVSDIEAPPMTEGIEFHDGSIWISEESASNKYLFGKLYGAGDVFSLPAACFASAE